MPCKLSEITKDNWQFDVVYNALVKKEITTKEALRLVEAANNRIFRLEDAITRFAGLVTAATENLENVCYKNDQ